MESNKNYTPDNFIPTRSAHCMAPVVICVSGGADSVALLHKALFSTLDICDGKGEGSISRQRLAVFHLNHGLRGQDADQDEAYVRDLCETYNLPCKIVRADVAAYAKDHDGNIENAGREIRYAEAYAYAKELSANTQTAIDEARILTAHTADDRAESFLMNVMRGTSLSGLTSIAHKRDIVVRPLLHLTHEELEKYLVDHGIEWRRDESNKDTSYLRSYVRYNVLPPMKKKLPKTPLKISSLCDVLTDENDYMCMQSHAAYQEIVSRDDEGAVSFNTSSLKALHPAILRRVLAYALEELSSDVRITSQALKDVIAILDNNTGSASLSGNIDVRIEHGYLYLRKIVEVDQFHAHLDVPGSVSFGPYTIEADLVAVDFDNVDEYVRDKCIEGKNTVAFIDTEQLYSPQHDGIKLTLDSFKPGDTIQPFGMRGKTKLVSDLLHDAHIPTHQRAAIPVIRNLNTGVIVCVGGIRTDERFSCRKTTKEFIQLKFHKD